MTKLSRNVSRNRWRIAVIFTFLSLPLSLPLPQPAPVVFAQSLPFEDKARYERTLEQKADDVLVRLLGPNQAKVVVETLMDFNRTEKLEFAPREKSDMFKWQAAGGDAQSGDYLLPGFPAAAGGGDEKRSYNRQVLYPSAFVKRMTVSIILNRDLPTADSENVRKVISEILMLDTKRGDQLTVLKAPFAPLWRTIWYTPETISLVLKYIMLAVMGIIAIIVVAIGFLKLAGAMSTMAKVQQSHQITMELGKGTGPGGADLPALGLGGSAEAARPHEETREDDAKPGYEDTVFNVRLGQVPFLVNMMVNEDPANVALVAGHLPPEVRCEFLKKLPSAFSSDVIISMSKVRFIEPDVINTLKDELERRLSGTVGGLDGALTALEGVALSAKRGLLNEIQKKQPELAAEVRKHILLPDDIALFTDRDLSLMVAAVKVEEWACALFDLPDAVRQKVKGQMAEKTWQMVEQSMSYGTPSAGKTEEAMERIMQVAAGLIKEGKIAWPSADERLMLSTENVGS